MDSGAIREMNSVATYGTPDQGEFKYIYIVNQEQLNLRLVT